MNVSIVHGDLLDQDVDVIVNTWNRNIIPWWLLLPQGVSGATKHGGTGPFKELRLWPIPRRGRLTSQGGCRWGDHPSPGSMLWRASGGRSEIPSECVVLPVEHGFIPSPSADRCRSGGFDQERAQVPLDELQSGVAAGSDGGRIQRADKPIPTMDTTVA
jgi:hypothetical protein